MCRAAAAFASLLGVLELSVASVARAQSTPSLWASWQAPAECPQETELVAQAEGFLGHTLNARNDRQLEIVGSVRADSARGFVAKLRVRTTRETQQRELAHRDCGELTEAAALIVALAIEPQLVVAAKASNEPEPPATLPVATDTADEAAHAADTTDEAAPAPPVSPRPLPVSDTSSAVAAASPRESEPSSGTPLHASLGALGLFGSSVLPGTGAGLGVQASVGPGRFRLAVQGAYWLSRFQPLQGADGPGVELGAWGLGHGGQSLRATADRRRRCRAVLGSGGR